MQLRFLVIEELSGGPRIALVFSFRSLLERDGIKQYCMESYYCIRHSPYVGADLQYSSPYRTVHTVPVQVSAQVHSPLPATQPYTTKTL